MLILKCDDLIEMFKTIIQGGSGGGGLSRQTSQVSRGGLSRQTSTVSRSRDPTVTRARKPLPWWQQRSTDSSEWETDNEEETEQGNNR